MNRTILDMLERRMSDGARRRNRSGRYMRDRKDYEDERYTKEYDYADERDYEDKSDYRRDYGPIKLSKYDMTQWKRKLQNADGTQGEHYDMHQILQAAEKLGITFRDFDEKELCMMTNVIYSDYCRVIKRHISPDKELQFCVEMAKAYFDDDDGPEPSEKLALYYHCIASGEDV